MKILFVQKIVGVAGSENYLLNILPGLLSRGVSVEFMALVPKGGKGNESKFINILSEHNIKVHTIYYTIPYINFCRKVNKTIRLGGYDLVHSNLIHADFFLALVKTFFNRKFILVSTKHGYEEKYTNQFGFDPSRITKNLYWRILKWSEQRINRSFAISKSLEHLFVGLGICHQSKIDMIHYGFTFNEPPKTDPSLRYSKNQLILVGRLTEFKGHRFALQAVSLLKDTIPDLILVIVGSGHLENKLKKIVSELNIEKNVIFYGYYSNGRQFMHNSDIVLIPSVAEGFGVVVLEAFSVKKPIVAFNVPSLDEHIVSEENGILVKPYNIELYATAIKSLLTNETKTSNIVNSALQGLHSYYSQDRMINETILFYENVLSENLRRVT